MEYALKSVRKQPKNGRKSVRIARSLVESAAVAAPDLICQASTCQNWACRRPAATGPAPLSAGGAGKIGHFEYIIPRV